MRLAYWVALGACIGCGGGPTTPSDGGGSGGSGMAMGARGGTTASGAGGTSNAGKGGAAMGGTGNTTAGGSGGSGNTTSGSGGTNGPGTSVIGACSDPNAVGPTLVRRISQLEYTNAVRDLFGVTIDPSDLPSDEKLAGVFTANVTTPLTTDQFTRYDTKAKLVGDQVAPGLVAMSGCDAVCTQAYFVGKARQAFHGVLEAADQATLEGLYTGLAADAADNALTLAASATVRFILDSPRFLYVVEFGTPDGTLARLTPGETAGRLASFLWRSVPDQALLDAADAGTLATADGLRAQAVRLFDDPRARPVLQKFAREWLGLTTTGSDPTALALDAESGDVFATLAQGTGSYGDLFSTTMSRGPAELAAFYGVTPGSDGSVTLPPERAGLLLRASFMRSHIKGSLGSPTQRGKVVRQAMLCDPVQPPGNVDMSIPEPMAGQTTQDVFDEHSASDACKGCHALMDPIGRAFGRFGPSGAFDAALATSTAGHIYEGNANAFAADFPDTAGLMNVLATSEVPEQCFAIQTARFALGRNESNADACALTDVWQGFEDGQLNLKTLFVEIATSSLMQTRNIVKAGEACR